MVTALAERTHTLAFTDSHVDGLRFSQPCDLMFTQEASLLFDDAGPSSNKLIIPSELRPRRKGRPICVLFMGRRGKGKSLCMSGTAQMQKLRFQSFGLPNKIASNYYLSFADYSHPYLLDALFQYPEWARRLLILVDEVATAFPGRRSLRESSLIMSYQLTQMRKMGNEYAFTTQFPQVLDLQLLYQIDLFIESECDTGDRAANLFCHDYWGQWTGKNWRKPWPPRRDQFDWACRLQNLDKVWGLYNTDEVIAPIAAKDSTVRERIVGRYWELKDPVAPQQTDSPRGQAIAEMESIAHKADAFLAEMGARAGAWNIRAVFNRAKAAVPELTSVKSFVDFLKDHGYNVWPSHGTFYAEKA